MKRKVLFRGFLSVSFALAVYAGVVSLPGVKAVLPVQAAEKITESYSSYLLESDVLYSYSASDHTARVIPAHQNKPTGDIVIPKTISYEGVDYTVIGLENSAFSENDITSVALPDTITSIGDSAFSNCKNLTSVSIPDTLTYFGNSVFFGCESLTNIKLPKSAKVNSMSTFSGCSNLKSAEIYVTDSFYFGECFPGCYALTDLTIHGTGKTIIYHFISVNNACNPPYPEYSLDTLTLDGVQTIGQGCFSSNKKIKNVTVSDSCLTTIEDGAFAGSTSLTNFNIPSSVKVLGEAAFSGCANLPAQDLSHITTFGSGAFYECWKAGDPVTGKPIDFEFSNNIESFGDGVFCYCQLGTVTVGPSFLDDITRKLTAANIHKLILKGNGSTSSIPEKAFYIAPPSPIITLSVGGSDSYLQPGEMTTTPTGTIDYLEISDVGSIGCSAFEGQDILTAVTLKNVDSIGESAFSRCKGLKTVYLPKFVTSVGNDAFKDCQGPVYYYSESSLTNADSWGLEQGKALACSKISVSASNCTATVKGKSTPDEILSNECYAEGDSITITAKPSGNYEIDQIVITDKNGNKIEEKNYSFVMPSSDVTITVTCKEKAKEETRPEDKPSEGESSSSEAGSSSSESSSSTPENKPSTPDDGKPSDSGSSSSSSESTSSDSGNTSSSSEEASSGDSKTPDQVQNPSEDKKPASEGTKIKDKTSKAKYKVTSSNEKKPTVQYIASTSKNKKSVTIPKTVTVDGVKYKVTSVAKNAFKDNKKLTSVTLSANITEIGNNAFAGCTKLKEVVIPKNVTKLGNNIFKGSGVKLVTVKTKKLTESSLTKKTFKGLNKDATVKTPKGKKENYSKLFVEKGGLSKKVTIK